MSHRRAGATHHNQTLKGKPLENEKYENNRKISD